MRPATAWNASPDALAADHRWARPAGLCRPGRCAGGARCRGTDPSSDCAGDRIGANPSARRCCESRSACSPALPRIIVTSEPTAARSRAISASSAIESVSSCPAPTMRRAARAPAARRAVSSRSARWCRARDMTCCCARWRGCSISTGSLTIVGSPDRDPVHARDACRVGRGAGHRAPRATSRAR